SNNTGVFIDATSDTTIGGTSAGARNVISGNHSSGISIRGLGIGGSNLVQGNFIGTDVTGSLPLGNTSGGVNRNNNTSGNTIGGTAAGAGNLIAFNAGSGVDVSGSGGVSNDILSNSIHSNTGLGISFGAVPTPNDPGDTDDGPNN